MTGNSRASIEMPASRMRHTVCASCGYRFERNDEVYRIHETGDVIHRDCRMEYFEDNIDEFASEDVI